MPILQTRMIALISGAKDYQQALRKLIRMIEKEEQDARQALEEKDPTTRADLLANVIQNIHTGAQELFLLNYPLDSGRIIDLEEAHFKRNKSKNIRSKDWLKKARLDGKYLTNQSKGATREQTADIVEKQERPDLDQEANSYLEEEDRENSGVLVGIEPGQVER